MMSIRPLEADDHGDWLRLWNGYLAFYRTRISPETRETVWGRLLDIDEPMSGAVAVLAGERLGLVHYVRHRSCWTVGDYCYLQDLFVESRFRGRGAGRKLIEYVYQEAAAHGCARVYWLTHESNAEAMLLYNRLAHRSGFIQYRKDFPPPLNLHDAFDPSI